MTDKHTLSPVRRHSINALYGSRSESKDALEAKASEFGVTFETVVRAISTEFWRAHTRSCVECETTFTENRPPFIEPREKICSTCVARKCPDVRILEAPRVNPPPASGRKSFDVGCARCPRQMRGYLSRKNNPIPVVCAYCVAEDVNRAIRARQETT